MTQITVDPYDTRIVTLFELSQVSAPLRSVLNEHPLDVQHPKTFEFHPNRVAFSCFCGPQCHAFSCKHETQDLLTLGIIIYKS